MRLGAACGIGALAFVLTACTGGTPSVTPLATPSPSEGPGAAANVTCGALSFYLDPALAWTGVKSTGRGVISVCLPMSRTIK